MNIREPEIKPEEILVLHDDQFHTDNVCIVTGAGTGIGRAIAIACAANNLMTVGFDTNEKEGKKTQRLAREMGGQMIFIPINMEKDDEVQYGVLEAAKLGSIKYVANIAGMQHIDPVENLPMIKYDQMQRILLRAPLYLSQLTIPYMKKSTDGVGVIGNMASIHTHNCTVNQPVYNITKCGLKALSQSISTEGGGKIRSFTVSTGFVKSPLALNQIPAQAKQRGITTKEVVHDVMNEKSRIKEMMSPIEFANLFLFGFSRFARYLIGGDVLLDSGVFFT